MSRRHKSFSRQNVRNVCKVNYSQIERMYADLGVVWIVNKDGRKRSWQPRDAAIIAKQLNEGMPNEPSSAKVVHNLIQELLTVIRQAQYQREMPNSKDTALVTKTIVSSEAKACMTLDPKVYAEIKHLQMIYPMLDFDEIKSCMTSDMYTDNVKRDLLKMLHKDRMDVWHKTQGRMLTAPF